MCLITSGAADKLLTILINKVNQVKEITIIYTFVNTKYSGYKKKIIIIIISKMEQTDASLITRKRTEAPKLIIH